VEPDHSTRSRAPVGSRSRIRRHQRHAPARNSRCAAIAGRFRLQPGRGGWQPITANTFGNAVARSRAQGVNGYNGFQLFANDAYSHYNSLQTTVSRRWGAGYFQAAYTFSRSTDATSTGNTAFNSAFNDESTLADSRGLSDFDRTHRLAVSYRYDLPFFKGETGLQGALLANWAISGITIIQSGSPFSVLDSGAGSAFLGLGSAPGVETASLASGSSLSSGLSSGDIHSRIDGYLNPAAFATAPLFTRHSATPISQIRQSFPIPTSAPPASATLAATPIAVPVSRIGIFR